MSARNRFSLELKSISNIQAAKHQSEHIKPQVSVRDELGKPHELEPVFFWSGFDTAKSDNGLENIQGGFCAVVA